MVFILVFSVGLGLDLVWVLIGFQLVTVFRVGYWFQVLDTGFRFDYNFSGFGYIVQVLVQFSGLVTHPPAPN